MGKAVRTTLGILVPEFPAQTHAFFWREVRALRELGVTVHMLSTRRPPADAMKTAEAILPNPATRVA
jgi:hypothetical protein